MTQVIEVNELTGDLENRVTEIKGEMISVMIGWKEKTIILWNADTGKKETVKSFDDLCFKSQGILSGEILMRTVETGLAVYG